MSPEQRIAEIEKTLREQADPLAVQRDAETHAARIERAHAQIAEIQRTTNALAHMPPLAPETEWRDRLVEWRQRLCDELLAVPPRARTDRELGTQQNLTLSILVIDQSLAVVNGTGYALHTLRLGELMRAAGFEIVGADPDRNYGGELPWFGSLPQVEHRIKKLTMQRDAAEAALAEAMLDDDAREKLTSERAAERDRRNALPQRKVRGDGTVFLKWRDGRIEEVTAEAKEGGEVAAEGSPTSHE